MFMNQILVFESSEITGFGIFNINLNLVVTVSTQFNNCNFWFFRIYNEIIKYKIFVLIFADNNTTYYWISNINTIEGTSIYEAIGIKIKELPT